MFKLLSIFSSHIKVIASKGDLLFSDSLHKELIFDESLSQSSWVNKEKDVFLGKTYLINS